jgi:hypothetical protein
MKLWSSLSFALFGVLAASVVACSADSLSSGSPDGALANAGPGGAKREASGGSSSGGGFNAGAPATGGSSGAAVPSPSSDGKITGPTPQSGQLTAGVWDDNLNFDWFKTYVDANQNMLGAPAFSLAERIDASKRWLQRTGSTELDIAFLLDTTGSMGDELSYLQAEIDGITKAIETKFPQTTPRYGLVLYKDKGDVYVTRSFDFGDAATFRARLAEQSAGGGGDLPEAVPEGLTAAMNLSWRAGAISRMAFWVADAPHHPGTEQQVRAQIDVAVQKGVHFYPVAASGTDPLAEYTMRSAAQLTGGRYVFLTDDSGIGNSHAEPHIPCYVVTRFDGAIVRMVESEMTGTHVEPLPAEVIRTVGEPQGGTCVTLSKATVSIY